MNVNNCYTVKEIFDDYKYFMYKIYEEKILWVKRK